MPPKKRAAPKADPKAKGKAAPKGKAKNGGVDTAAKVEVEMVPALVSMEDSNGFTSEQIVELVAKYDEEMRFPQMQTDSTILHLASRRNGDPVDEVLQNLREDVNQRGYFAQTPLHCSALRPSHAQLTSLLLAYGADPTLATLNGTTPLHNAVSHGGSVQVASILQSKTDPCVDTRLTRLPSILDVNIPDGVGWTPLHLAALQRTELSTMVLLLERKANANAQNWEAGMGGETPLHCACRDHHACVELLLDAEADVNLVTVSGATALHLLVAHWSVETLPSKEPPADHLVLVRNLLKCRASVNAENKAGQRPMDVAKNDDAKKLLMALCRGE